jgi:putative phage-type endonuclease
MITDKQREERKLGIGGSDMPIILGLSSYKTPYQLYLEKTGLEEPKQEESQFQYWGNQLEEIVRNEFSKRNGFEIMLPDTQIHPLFDFMRANVDGYIQSENAVLEVKCASSFMAYEWGEDGSDVIPMQYLVQVAHYCSVLNASKAYIAVLIGGNDYREFLYERDLELEGHIIEKAKEFWACVQNKTPPEPINQIDLKLMFPRHAEEKMVTVNGEIKEQLTEIINNRFQIKKLSDVEDKYKFNIMQFMKDAECLIDEEGKPIVSWKANKNGSRVFRVKESA